MLRSTSAASEPTYVTNTIAKQQTISDATLTNNGGYTIELGEKLYTKLKLSSGAMDDFGRPIHIWTNDTKKIGEYAEDEDAKYTDSVKLGSPSMPTSVCPTAAFLRATLPTMSMAKRPLSPRTLLRAASMTSAATAL